MSQKPNFLFIMTDQHCFDQLACHGNSLVQTPNIDKLFAQGSSIDGMHTAMPICMPNRQAFLTMRMCSVNGGHSNGVPLNQDNTTFPELMRAAGYRTALIGKSHLQTMTEMEQHLWPEEAPAGQEPAPAGLQNAQKSAGQFQGPAYEQERPFKWEQAEFEPATPYYGFDELILSSRHAEVADFHHGRYLDSLDPSIAAGTGRSNALKKIDSNPQVYASTMAPEHYPTRFIGDQTASWLEQHAANQAETPFFLWCSFPDPHHPWTPPVEYYDMYDPADVTLPDSFYESSRNQTEELRWALERQQNSETDRSKPYMAGEDEARKIIATAYGMISFIDEVVGEMVAKLEATGLAENTVIVFTSDHGDYMGHHGLFLKGPSHYQTLVKVPFIWCDSDEQYNQGSVKALASYVDIGRTILDRAGLWPFHGCQGQSLLPLLAGSTDAHRERVLVEHTVFVPKFGLPYWTQLRTVVTGRYRLSIYTHRDQGELYDLAEDPGEMVNLWDSMAHSTIKGEMLFHLAQEMAVLADTARLPVRVA